MTRTLDSYILASKRQCHYSIEPKLLLDRTKDLNVLPLIINIRHRLEENCGPFYKALYTFYEALKKIPCLPLLNNMSVLFITKE